MGKQITPIAGSKRIQVNGMEFVTRNGEHLQLTQWALDATLPLVRADSVARPVAGSLWGIFTPSTGVIAALLFGTETACKDAVREYGK